MNREADLFADSLDLAPGDRTAFLAQACAGDAALRARVEALLRAHDQGQSFLPAPLAPTRAALPGERAGETIAHYKLLEKIGEGGCGVVWLAEQGEPLRRQVAIKVIKLGMDTQEVIARFDAERHALARMDHPNIAQVYDAGATASGRPFFAMELVRGQRISDFCDANHLPTSARLALFVQVCRAIQHAHQKGIIHRDIKPSNILVSFHDGIAVPKVIDFGIAKATAGHLTDRTLHTAVEQTIGTPSYMSPEQIEPVGQDIDTRSDVYSLGVLLYELLAGRPPFDPQSLAAAGLAGMRRVIRESDPSKPSTRLSTLSEADRSTVARQRATDPRQLIWLLRGDLDWIVMRCLEKKRTRRYETASELARDVEHFLHHEPVAARPPSTLYRLAKFAARHRVLTASLTTAASLLVLVAAGTSWLAWHERQLARAEARQASRTDFTLGSQYLEEGKVSEGLAFLVRAARTDPHNHAVAPRLLSALAYRSFLLPVGPPLVHPGSLVFLRDAHYAPDGRTLRTNGVDGHSRLWNLADGRLLSDTEGEAVVLAGHANPVTGLIASGDREGRLRFWMHEPGRTVPPPLAAHRGLITAAYFSPDGRWLGTGSVDGTAKLWDSASGELKVTLDPGGPVGIGHLYFAPDSTRLLVTAQGRQWRIWTVPAGEPVLPPQRSPELSITGHGLFSPDGRQVVLTDTKGAQRYDASTGAPVGPHLDHERPGQRAAFSRDGTRLATAAEDGQIKLWSVPSGQLLLPPLRHGGAVNAVAFIAGDRQIITSASDGIVRLWDTATGELAAQPVRSELQKLTLTSDGGEFMTFNRYDSTARRWRTQTGAILPTPLPGRPDRVHAACNESGTTVWAFYPDRAQAFALPSAAPAGPALPFPAKIDLRNFILSRDGFCLPVQLQSGQTEFWDLRGSAIVRRPRPPVGTQTNSIRFSPDSSRFAHHHDDRFVHVWDTQTGALVGEGLSFSSSPNDLKFSPDNRRLAVATPDGQITFWDLATSLLVGATLRTRTAVSWMDFSHDGRWLATATQDDVAQLWEVTTGRAVGPPLPHRTMLNAVFFTRDSRGVLTLAGGDLRLWDASSGTPLTPSITPPVAPGDALVLMAFSPDERGVATATRQGEVRVYDTATGQLLIEPIRTRRAPSRLAFGFDATSRYVICGTATGELDLWPLPPLSLRAPVPDWLPRLGTAFAGGSLDRFAAFREQPAGAAEFDALRQELARLPDDAPYVAWGRWLLADSARRPISPNSMLTRAEAERLAALPP